MESLNFLTCSCGSKSLYDLCHKGKTLKVSSSELPLLSEFCVAICNMDFLYGKVMREWFDVHEGLEMVEVRLFGPKGCHTISPVVCGFVHIDEGGEFVPLFQLWGVSDVAELPLDGDGHSSDSEDSSYVPSEGDFNSDALEQSRPSPNTCRWFTKRSSWYS